MVQYDYDSNAILQQAVKSCQAVDFKNAFTSMVDELEGQVEPELFILNNEIWNELKAILKKYEMKYQLVPPTQHRRNAAERAIQTFKNYFLAGLATLPPNFLMIEWDRLLKQATITLNLLRNARLNPKLSAHAFLHGLFDYNKYPSAPPSTQIVTHEKNTHCQSWDLHRKDVWYVGPAMEHCRLKFLPEKIPFPQVTTQDYLKNAAQEILELLKNPKKLVLPYKQPQKELSNAIATTARLLHQASTKPTISHPVRIPNLPPMATFFQNPCTPLP